METKIEILSRRIKNNSELVLNSDMHERVRLNLIDIAEKLKVENQPEESKENFKFLIGKDVRWRYIDWDEESFTPWLKFRERDLGIFDDNSLDIVQFKL